MNRQEVNHFIKKRITELPEIFHAPSLQMCDEYVFSYFTEEESICGTATSYLEALYETFSIETAAKTICAANILSVLVESVEHVSLQKQMHSFYRIGNLADLTELMEHIVDCQRLIPGKSAPLIFLSFGYNLTLTDLQSIDVVSSASRRFVRLDSDRLKETRSDERILQEMADMLCHAFAPEVLSSLPENGTLVKSQKQAKTALSKAAAQRNSNVSTYQKIARYGILSGILAGISAATLTRRYGISFRWLSSLARCLDQFAAKDMTPKSEPFLCVDVSGSEFARLNELVTKLQGMVNSENLVL